ncbi:hypothetical protein HDV06_003604 [Boothiomyces sp. JEL0866]|nr:hypothetical protein HDV06_003604 [Boothiomyces sp. JEL0866]
MSLPLATVLQIQAGSMLCGTVITLASIAIFKHGLSFDIFNDRTRQKVLNLIALIGGISCILACASQQSNISIIAINVTTFVLTICGQYGLVIINHNTIIRLSNAFPIFAKTFLEQIQRCCIILYFLPWVVFTPLYFAFQDSYNNGIPYTISTWTTQGKIAMVVLIMLTEFFAALSDFVLFNSIVKLTGQTDKLAKRSALHTVYGIIWVFMIIDVLIKILIINGYHIAFDNSVTVLVVALRAQANLAYGVMLKETLKPSKIAVSSAATDSIAKSSTITSTR